MDAAALAGLCALFARGEAGLTLPPGVTCPAATAPQRPQPLAALRGLTDSVEARDGVARVTYAEAANQGDSGLAAVVYTILNRLQDGRWGRSVDAVLNAPSQFEPVMRAGGDWRRLPPVSSAAQARIDTILNLALDGRLPDLTNGARFFQNPTIVRRRAQAGQVAPSLVNFGGAAPSAVIGAHSFYVEARGRGNRTGGRVLVGQAGPRQGAGGMFVGDNRAPGPDETSPAPGAVAVRSGDPSRALFVGADGQVSADQP
ncbi:MAG TPA: cell wall hydrolase [Caulobacteraceae bacterium]|jgi:hypothetical protein|nr:cell wall hydrolase [Caulobacteraceae bacterium]